MIFTKVEVSWWLNVAQSVPVGVVHLFALFDHKLTECLSLRLSVLPPAVCIMSSDIWLVVFSFNIHNRVLELQIKLEDWTVEDKFTMEGCQSAGVCFLGGVSFSLVKLFVAAEL